MGVGVKVKKRPLSCVKASSLRQSVFERCGDVIVVGSGLFALSEISNALLAVVCARLMCWAVARCKKLM